MSDKQSIKKCVSLHAKRQFRGLPLKSIDFFSAYRHAVCVTTVRLPSATPPIPYTISVAESSVPAVA